MATKDHIETYLQEVAEIAKKIDRAAINKTIEILRDLREKKGRLFIIGVGGSAANASHAANDFRRIANIETYTPMDNIAELTARVNDEGWESVFVGSLKHSQLGSNDAVFVLSVGGGNAEKNISKNIVHALDYAKEVGARVLGIVSRDGGHTAKMADACILVPVVNAENVTAHAEVWQAAIWHAIVFHPKLKVTSGKWESVQKPALT
jgi:D-sedoheptulose 7-phosphate isomerase